MSGAPHTSTVHTLPPAPKRWSTEPVASWSPVQAQLAQTTVTLAARSQPRSLLLLLHSLPCRNAAAAFHVLCANFPSVPIVGIVIVLVFLHRRNNKKLAAEDAKDKYKSMDFGMGGAGKKGKGGPEMSITEKELRGNHGRGISLEGGSPYILPVGLHGSRESFHSLSRSHNDPHDPYRPVTFLNGDNQSIRSQGRGYGQDNQSLYTTRTTSSGGTQRNRMGDGLLKNAQRMSTSVPMRAESLSPDSTRSPDIKFPEQNIALSPLNPRFEGEPLAMPSTELPDSRNPPTSSSPANVPVISVPVPAAKQESTPTMPAYPARIQSQQAVVHEHANTTSIISTSSYGAQDLSHLSRSVLCLHTKRASASMTSATTLTVCLSCVLCLRMTQRRTLPNVPSVFDLSTRNTLTTRSLNPLAATPTPTTMRTTARSTTRTALSMTQTPVALLLLSPMLPSPPPSLAVR
jgi:hypothetical protein